MTDIKQKQTNKQKADLGSSDNNQDKYVKKKSFLSTSY